MADVLRIAGVLLQWDAPHRFDSLAVGGYLLWCSSHCFSHFPLACRNLRIDITTIVEANSRMGYECEPDKVQIPRYLNAYYYYRANGEDAIPYERYTARLNRIISALLVEGYKVEFDYYTTEEG